MKCPASGGPTYGSRLRQRTTDVSLYLEEYEKGESRYVSREAPRLERATADPGDTTAGLPYHRGEVRPGAMTPERRRGVVMTSPHATLFAPGHRSRVTVTGADKANARHTAADTAAPNYGMARGGWAASFGRICR